MLTYFGATTFPDKDDLNHDGKVDLIDFSIMLYYLNQPLRGTLASTALSMATADVAAFPITLDVGKGMDGDWLAAWNMTAGLADVHDTEISTDNGISWRPAASPLPAWQNAAVERDHTRHRRARQPHPSKVQEHRAWWQILAAAAAGALASLILIFILKLISRRRGRR